MSRRIAVGDIHGCIRTFRQMVEKELTLERSDSLFLLGDYIDRGPDSKAVTDYIMWLQQEAYQVVPLMGNHEYLLLCAMGSAEYYRLWMLNSGFTTLRDFGIDGALFTDPNAIFQIPAPYPGFFRGLPYYAETPGFFISHGCFDGRTENPLEDKSSMIWRRVESYNDGFLNGRKLIHGHTPAPLNEIRRRVDDQSSMIYNLDAGCVYANDPERGYLVAMDLDSGHLFAVKNCEQG